MVSCLGRSYGEAFQGFCRVTQRYSLSPTILNVVVDSVVGNWVSLVAGGAVGLEGWMRLVLRCTDFFYVGNSLVAPTCTE